MQFWQYQQLAEPPVFGSERSTPDKYLPLDNLPRWDRVWRQDLFPSHFVPVSNTFAERTTPDKYFSQAERPTRRISRIYDTGPSLHATAPQVNPDSWFIEPDRLSGTKRQQYAYLYLSGPVSNLFPETVSADRFHPLPNQPLFDRKRLQYGFPYAWIPERQPVPRQDGWIAPVEVPRFDLKRTQYSFPYSALPDRQPLPPRDGWIPQTERPVFDLKRFQYTYPYFAIDSTLTKERTTPDKWHPQIEQPLFDRKRQQYAYDWASFDPAPFATPVFAGSWWQLPNQPLFAAKNLYWITNGETILAAFTERTAPDKYAQAAELPRRRQPVMLPSESPSIFVERGTVDGWDYPRVEVMRPRPRPMPPQDYALTAVFSERTTPDKYVSLPEVPQRRTLAPIDTSAQPIQFTVVPPSPVLNTWQPQSVPAFDLRRTQFLHPAIFVVPPFPCLGWTSTALPPSPSGVTIGDARTTIGNSNFGS